MSSIDIYSILASKPHNPHYLNRYWKFIQKLQYQRRIKYITEQHHICPKSNDLFPEYAKLYLHNWNSVHLTKRQHFIAHYLLSKSYGGKQIYAFWAMCNKQSPSDNRIRKYKVTSKIYDYAKFEFKKINTGSLDKVYCTDNLGNKYIVSTNEYKNNPNLFSNMKNKKSIINRYTLEKKLIDKKDQDLYDESIWVSVQCKGIYHTPYGSFNNPRKTNPEWCKNNDRIITYQAVSGSTSNKKQVWLTKDMIGKTYKEVGFWYEEINLI